MSDDTRALVETACAELAAANQPITFNAIAERAGVGRATLYRNPQLRAIVEEHRQRTRDAHTLTGLAAQIDHLRQALEAVAERVRRHEEQLRQLNQRKPGR